MPIRAARSIVKKLSFYYYDYGKIVSSHTYLLLGVSLTLVSYFSVPIITKYEPITYNNIPLTHISTSLDAQCWHASAHVEFNNFSLSRNPPSSYLVTEQIRLSQPDQPVSFPLVQQAQAIYKTITATLELDSICYKHNDQCLIHAPPFHEWENEQDWRTKTTTMNHMHYKTHPYSVYSNATFDSEGRFVKADAILLTFILNQTQHGNAIHVWNKILQQVKIKHHILNAQQEQGKSLIWSASSNILPHMIQYKFNLFPFDISAKVQFSVMAYVITFYIISVLFGKSNMVKSGYSFGLAAVFLSIACFTTTWGIFDKLGVSFHSVPWYLLLLVINIGCLENVFLLTNAVLNTGHDMLVQEKISRGLQSVGVPMTATLIAELLILKVGTFMDSDLIQEFCTFIQVAITVEFFLNSTFIIAVLSVDIKRVELADLDDHQISKRFHQSEQSQVIEDNKQDTTDFKEIKTHRIFNAFMLCSMLLFLSLLCTNRHTKLLQEEHTNPSIQQTDLIQLSDQFWSTVNPQKDVTWLQIQPPQLLIFDSDLTRVQSHLDYLHRLYHEKSMAVRYTINHQHSLFRLLVLSTLQKICVLLLKINFPALILCLVMLAIITWMTPKWRKQWLVPLLIHCFNQFFLTVFKYFPVKRWYSMYVMKKQNNFMGPDVIALPNSVRTLRHQHVSDIQSIDTHGNKHIISCGLDGRVVLWNSMTWIARLDVLHPTRTGGLQAHHHHHKNRKKTITLTKKKPRIVKVDEKYAAAVYDETIRIWNVHTGALVNELDACGGRVVDIHFTENNEGETSYLVSAHRTGLLHEWDVVSGDCRQTMHTGRAIILMHIVNRWMFVTSKDGSIQCWEYSSRQNGWSLTYTIQLNSMVTSIATKVPVVGTNVLVTGCKDGTVKVWRLETGELLCALSLGSACGIQFIDDGDEEDESDDEERPTISDHRASIVQVAVTKYCHMEYGPGLCCGADTCDGFLVASSSSDNKVHVWKLERGSCLHCGSRRKRYRHRRNSISSSDESDNLIYNKIEPMKYTFLGKVEQPGGSGIVFCGRKLAGVRRVNSWEAWFVNLQHSEPKHHSWKIPVETINLDRSADEEERTHMSYLKSTLLNLFTHRKGRQYSGIKYKGNIHESKNITQDTCIEKDPCASEILPFSKIRHLVSLDESGLACDFGNFIKLVYLTGNHTTDIEYDKKISEKHEEQEESCQCDDKVTSLNKSLSLRKRYTVRNKHITNASKIPELAIKGDMDYISLTQWLT